MNKKAVGRVGLTLAVAALVPSLFIWSAGQNPLDVLSVLISQASSARGSSEVVLHMVPLTLIGLGVAIALRAGIFNVGADGQLIAGSVLAVAIAPILAGWGVASSVVFLAAGFVGGAALGALVGWLRVRFSANEIIVTIMLNYVAAQFASYLVRGPLQESMKIYPRSYPIPDDSALPVILQGTRLHAGLFIAIAAVVIVAILMQRSTFGFRSSVLGASPGAAQYSGIKVGALTVLVMAISGGLAGLAGATEVAGLYGRLEETMGEGLGLSGIAVALIARLNPIGIPFAAALFGIFVAGSGSLQRELGLPVSLIWIIEATAIFAVAALQWAWRGQVAGR